MEVGLVFSSKDPKQKEARDSIIQFINESGILAEYSESDKSVDSPTLVIDGLALAEKRKSKRNDRLQMYPTCSDMLAFLEKNLWCL